MHPCLPVPAEKVGVVLSLTGAIPGAAAVFVSVYLECELFGERGVLMTSSSYVGGFGLAVSVLLVAGAGLLLVPRPAMTVVGQGPEVHAVDPAAPSFEVNVGQTDSSAAFWSVAARGADLGGRGQPP